MKSFNTNYPKQKGAVLVVGLVTLTVMTLMVVSMIKTSALELKIGGVHHNAEEVFANAEMALTLFISSSPKYTSGCVSSIAADNCFFAAPPPNTTITERIPGNPTTREAIITQLGLQRNEQVVVTATQQGNCIDDPNSQKCPQGVSSCLKIAIFDIQAVSTSNANTARAITHQGISTPSLGGACP